MDTTPNVTTEQQIDPRDEKSNKSRIYATALVSSLK